MKILLTGGAGFIGSNLAERLVSDGHELTVVDNFHTGTSENLAHLSEKIKLVEAKSGAISEFDSDYDAIIHKGVASSTPMYKKDPRLLHQSIEDFMALLEFARKKEIRIIWASTSSLYNGHVPPHNENLPVKVTDFYSEARHYMERLADLYNQLYGVNSIGLRYFSVYGPKERSKKEYANLISQFMWSFMENKSPIVYGDGNQTRDFTYINDVVSANIVALESRIKFGIYNVGNGRETTINEMIEILRTKLKTDIPVKYVPNTINNYVYRTMADTTKAEKELGFKAKISLEEGIDRLILYYSENNLSSSYSSASL